MPTLRKNDDKKTLTLSKNKMTIKYQLWANVILKISHKGIGKVWQDGGLALLDFLFSILFVDGNGDGDDGDDDDDDGDDGDGDDDEYQDYLGNGW